MMSARIDVFVKLYNTYFNIDEDYKVSNIS